MRRLVAFACLVLLGGCAALFNARRPCLSGPVPRLGERDADEMYRFLRAEHERSRRATSALVRAQIYERLPPLIPDASDRSDEPTCAPEIVDAADDVLGKKPIRYDRMLVARVRAAGRVGDTTDVMPQKAAFLIAIVSLPDRDLTPYQLGAEERGPPPPRDWLRRLALASLAHSSMYYNVPEAGAFLAERVRTSTDPREQILLRWSADALMDRAVRDLAIAHPSTDPRALARTWIADLPRLLARQPDPVLLELAVVRLEILGKHARSLGVDAELRATLDDLVTRRGTVPVAATSGGARDLLRAALGARFDLDYTGRRGASGEMSWVRTPYDPRTELDREPAGGRVPNAAVEARGAQLERDLSRATVREARCAVFLERARWVTPRQSRAVFTSLAPGRQERADASCRITAALSIDSVAPPMRAHLLETALVGGVRIESLEIARRNPEEQARRAAALALRDSLDLVDREPGLRRILATAGVAPLAGPETGVSLGTFYNSEVMFQLQPAFDRLLAFHASGAAGSSLAAGAAIVDTWIADIREVLQHPAHSIYPWEIASLRVLAMSEWAPAFGRAAEARQLFADILGDKYPEAPGAVLVLANLKRAATISAGVLSRTASQL